MNNLVKDPVCGMQVDPHHLALEYQQMNFAFCSSQCRERFLDNPHLYIGFPQHKAPRQENREVLKERLLRTDHVLDFDQAQSLTEALKSMMGIKSVVVGGSMIEITYDLLQVTEEQIEATLAEIGIKLGEGWAEQLRRAFVHYEEEFEIGNLEVYKKHRFHRYE
ncbi:coproporphyrinogen-III oxidase [Novimethylophilus kurashikiensis]|uniref:Coproporphyrinogen-III oxidase n=1 Tax=Novimethylophilus kurashikiensis TaxID=1825523 RepID=A0A2R5F970_9PROT|nr:YHS domain-containing protein [Novimethylophilus kurashikiensis]GBG14780.1 coproporphyrinogen-III oxidase [Novimethylophilus kurashikiensis]